MTSGDGDGSAPYRRLADDLRRRIAEGVLGPGERLPSVRQLAEQRGVATLTVQNAFRLLQSEGLIRAETGKGNFVCDDASARAREADPLLALAAKVEALEERVRALESAARPGEPSG